MRYAFLGLVSLIMIVISLSFAQVRPTEVELPGVETPIISEKYIVMPGDNLLITIIGKTTYSYSTVVTYEGRVTINIPMAQILETGTNKPYYEITVRCAY